MQLQQHLDVFGRLCGLAFQQTCRPGRGTDTYAYVFHEAATIFVPVPKTGTTSALHVLQHLNSHTDQGESRVRCIHEDAKFLRLRKSQIDLTLWSQYFSFCFVRNPFDRLVSAYKDKIVKLEKTPGFALAMGCRRGMPFDQFVDKVALWPREFLNDHLLPQARIISRDGHVLPEFLGRFENLEHDWGRLADRLHQLSGRELPPITKNNTSPGKSYREYYSQRSRDTAAEIYGEDLELFQYEF